MRFENQFVSSIEVKVLWFVTPCGVAEGYQRFEGPRYIILQGEVLRNVGIILKHYTLSQPTGTRLEFSTP
jgi:hypothetical protein